MKSIMEETYDESYGSEDEKELQIAFEKGLLKPGLNEEIVKYEEPHFNNTKRLKEKLNEIKLDLPWVETLDLTCLPAPLAPELALQIEAHKDKQTSNEKTDDLVYDDFQREMTFYRLGQSAVLEGLPKLQSLGILTKRPEDYFAEMAKGDEHMHKVREKLQVKENLTLRREKARKLRELKKFGKKIQVQRQLERQKEKKQILDKLKKYRKGKVDTLDFLDDDAPDKVDSNGILKSKKMLREERNEKNENRIKRDKKYGLGGKKKGWKRNTAKDLDGPLDSAGKKIQHLPRGKIPVNKNKKRLGKNKRAQMNQNSDRSFNKNNNNNKFSKNKNLNSKLKHRK